MHSAKTRESWVGSPYDSGLDMSPSAITIRKCDVINWTGCRRSEYERRWNDQKLEHDHNVARLIETAPSAKAANALLPMRTLKEPLFIGESSNPLGET